jgi:hypothetical protein
MNQVYSGHGVEVMVEGMDETIAGLQHMAASTMSAYQDLLVGASQGVKELMKYEPPKATGELAGTIDYLVDIGELKSDIGPSDEHYGRPVSRAIEFGRPAGSKPPPAAELMRRYPYLSLGQAIAAAKTIANRGIKPNSFVFRTYYEAKDILDKFGLFAAYTIQMSFYH